MVKENPKLGETAFLDDTYTAGLLLRDKQAILGSRCGSIKFSDEVTLLASKLNIVSGIETRLTGKVVIDGELILNGEEMMTPTKMRIALLEELRGSSDNE